MPDLPSFDTALQLEAAKIVLAERSLFEFLRQAWPHFESAAFVPGWHLQAIAEHLEAINYGQIRRLIINIPPRFCKTNLVAVAWPTWTWAHEADIDFPLIGAHVRFLCASYGATKAQTDGVTARRLIASNWYQRNWGHLVAITKDRDNQEQYDTTAGGSRISTGIPESLGKGGAIRIIDDPHKTDEVESDRVREGVIRAYDEIWRTRANDPGSGAEVVIMQRQAENDLSGHLLEENDVVHLCLPLEYDIQRHCATPIGFSDPRKEDGELLWPQRFDQKWVEVQKKAVGDYAWAAQYLQSPQPRGGGLIKRDWWKLWEDQKRDECPHCGLPLRGNAFDIQHCVCGWKGRAQSFPPFEQIVATVDTAITLREESDYSACCIWGIWRDSVEFSARFPSIATFVGVPRIMLVYAWRDRLTLRDLANRLAQNAVKFKIDRIRIENTTLGVPAAQELRSLLAGETVCAVDLETLPRGVDKFARLQSVQYLFQDGVVYAPDRQWAQMVIDEVAMFPRGAHDDLVDCTSAALRWFRDSGALLRKDEHEAERASLLAHKPQRQRIPLYPA